MLHRDVICKTGAADDEEEERGCREGAGLDMLCYTILWRDLLIGCMDGCMHGWIHVWLFVCMDAWIHEYINTYR